MKLALILALLTAPLMAATPSLTSPAPGSTLTGSSATFTWSANGTTVQQYNLWVGSTPGANNYGFCVEPGTVTSCTVANLPTNGSQVYVRLAWETGTTWGAMPTAAAFTSGSAAPPPPSSTLTGFTCTALSGSTSTCTVTISAAAPTGGFVVTLSSPSPTVTVPPSVTVAAGAKSATFPATVNPVVLTAKAGTVTDTASLSLAGGTAPPPASSGAYLVTLVLAQPNPPLATYQIWDSANGGAYGLLSGTGPLASGSYSFYAIGFDASGNASPHSNTQSLVIP